ncbi:hypothetical protein VTO42DRAFT_6772 [Malbranchea cinnamomea]
MVIKQNHHSHDLRLSILRLENICRPTHRLTVVVQNSSPSGSISVLFDCTLDGHPSASGELGKLAFIPRHLPSRDPYVSRVVVSLICCGLLMVKLERLLRP